MKSIRIKYGLLNVFLIPVLVLFASFSPLVTGIPAFAVKNPPGNSSVNNIISSLDDPEFNSKTNEVIIPLKQAGKLFLIEANIDGIEGNLILDTGAGEFVLNNTYFRNYVKTERANSSGITGHVGSNKQIVIAKMDFSDLSYKKLRADLANLGHLENRTGNKILGLIGFGLLRNLEMVIDPVNSELTLYKIDKTGNRLNQTIPAFKPDLTVKIENSNNILFLKGTVAGRELKFCFDTGAETNVICSDCNKKILSTLTITRRASLKGAGTSVSEVLFGRMNEFSIGDQQLPNMEAIITNLDALSEVYGTRIDGMLGYSFLKNGIFCVNFVKKQVEIRFMKGEFK